MTIRGQIAVLLGGITLTSAASLPSFAATLPAIPQLSSVGNLIVFDDFNRGDTSPGMLGVPPIGVTWDLRGAYVSSFPLPPATSGQIQGGAFVDNAPYTVYAAQTASTTVRNIGARVSWGPSAGVANSTTFAMLISANNNFISDMVHFVVNRSGWELQVRGSSPGAGSTGGAFVTIASQTFNSIWPANGTPLSLDVSISGQSITVDANGKITTTSDSRIPNLIGPYAVWEHYYPVQGSQNIDALSIDDVWAGTGLSERNTPDTGRLLPKASELISEAYGSLMWQHLSEMSVGKEGRIRNRISSSVDSSGPSALGGFLSGQVIDGQMELPSAASANAHGYLLAAGLDYPFSNYLRLGVSISYGSVKALTPANDRVDTSANQMLLYGRFGQRAFIDGFVGGSIQSMHAERSAVLDGVEFITHGHVSSTSPIAGIQLGDAFNFGGARLQPAIGVQYTRPNIDSYTETGGLPAIRFNAFNNNELNSRLGFDANWSVRVGRFVVRPDTHAFFVANVINSNKTLVGESVATGEPVNLAIAKISPEWFEFGLGADIQLWRGALLSARYGGTTGRNDLDYRVWTASLQLSL